MNATEVSNQHALIAASARADRFEAALRAIADTKTSEHTNHAQLCALLISIAKTELSQ